MATNTCIITNSILTRIMGKAWVHFMFVIMIGAFVFSSCDYNLFGYKIPDPEELLSDGTIEEFIDYLYMSDFQKELEDDVKREKVIDKLEEKISNKSGQDRIKHRMALALVYARTSEFQQIYTVQNSVRIKTFVDNNEQLLPNPRNLTNNYFNAVKGEDLTAILTNSSRLLSVLAYLGNDLQANGNRFPTSVQAVRGDFVFQVLMVGFIEMLILNVVVPDPSEESRQYRIDLVSDFIGNPQTAVEFDYVLHYSDCMFGSANNPSGIEYVLEAGGYPRYITLLREAAIETE